VPPGAPVCPWSYIASSEGGNAAGAALPRVVEWVQWMRMAEMVSASCHCRILRGLPTTHSAEGVVPLVRQRPSPIGHEQMTAAEGDGCHLQGWHQYKNKTQRQFPWGDYTTTTIHNKKDNTMRYHNKTMPPRHCPQGCDDPAGARITAYGQTEQSRGRADEQSAARKDIYS